MKNKILILGLAVVMFASVATAGFPAVAQAAGLTQEQVNMIINLLRSFDVEDKIIDNVYASLTGSSGGGGGGSGSAAWCYTFNNNLRVGSVGNDTIALLTALEKEGFSAGQGQRGVLDEALASLVVGFQEKYASEILAPNGLAHGTGFVGASTRAKLNSLYGCNVVRPPSPQPLVVSSSEIIGNQTTYTPGQTIKFSVRGMVSNNSIGGPAMGFNVQASMYSTSPKETIQINGVYQSFNATYNSNTALWDVTMTAPSDASKTYTIHTAFYCSNSQAGCASGQIDKTFNFNLSSQTQPSITVLSPNGGTWQIGTTQRISWQTNNISSPNDKMTIYIVPTGDLSKNYNLAQQIPNTGSYNYVVDDPARFSSRSPLYVAGGQFKIFVCAQASGNPDMCSYGIDYSEPFTITSPTATQPSATITTSAQTTNPTPYIIGTANGVNQVGITISNSGGKVYGSGLVSVINGNWSVNVSPALALGQHTINVYDANNNLLTTSPLNIVSSVTTQPSISSISVGGATSCIQNTNLNCRMVITGTNFTATGNTVKVGAMSVGLNNVGHGNMSSYDNGTKINVDIPTNINAGDYNVVVSNANGASNSKVFTMKPNSTQPYVTSVTPSSGPMGSTITIRGGNFSRTATNYVQLNSGSLGVPASVVSPDGSTLTVTLPNYNIAAGTVLKIWVDNDEFGASDQNTTYLYNPVTFTVTATTATQPSITVLSPNGGESYVAGDSNIHITYSSANMVGSTLTAYLYSPTLNNVRSVLGIASNSGSIDMQLAKGNTIDTAGQYKITLCSNVYVVGKDVCDSSDSYFTITSPTVIPAAPVVNLSANQIATSDGQPRSYTVTWSATGATSCVLTTNATKDTEDFDFWSGYIGPVQTSGSITAQVYSGATVTITCTGSGGTTAKSVNLIGNAATSSLTPEMISAMTTFSQQNNLNTANVLRAVEQLMKAFR